MRRDRLLLGAGILLVLALSSIPSLFGFLCVPRGGWWTGILTRNTADVNGYLSIVEEIRQGHYRARNLFTAEPHPPFQIRPYFMLLGLIGRLFPFVSTVVLMELGRIVAATILLVILSVLTRRLFEKTRERVIAFLILALGSGLGWLQLDPIPLDLGLVECSTFLTLISPPLYSISLSLILGILLCLDAAWNSQSHTRALWYSVFSGIFGLWLGLDRPFSLATMGIAVAATMFLQFARKKELPIRRMLRSVVLLAGVSLALGYQVVQLWRIPVYAEWNRQHILPTPDAARLFFSVGLLLPAAILGVRPFFRTRPTLAGLAGFYIIVSFGLSHSPISQQVRFLEGQPVCLALFACCGVMLLLRRIQSLPVQTMCATLIVVALVPSSFAAVTRDLEAIMRQSPPQYIPRVAVEAMQELGTLSSPEEAVFSSEASGNFLVAYSGRPVVLGHRIATANYPEKLELVTRFFQTKGNDPHAYELFRKSEANWLFWGPEEAWLAKGIFRPKDAPFLKPVYTNRFITLYRLSVR